MGAVGVDSGGEDSGAREVLRNGSCLRLALTSLTAEVLKSWRRGWAIGLWASVSDAGPGAGQEREREGHTEWSYHAGMRVIQLCEPGF